MLDFHTLHLPHGRGSAITKSYSSGSCGFRDSEGSHVDDGT